jgi:hypothetical protein
MMPTMQVVDVSPSAFSTAASDPAAAGAAAMPLPPPAQAAVAPVSPSLPARDDWEGGGGDGLGVEGGRDLGRRMSMRLSNRRASTGGTPLRQFSKNS